MLKSNNSYPEVATEGRQTLGDSPVIRKMLFLRASQIIINERYKKGEFKVPIHLGLGHEAIAVAVDQVMQRDDALLLSHRNIHYNLARLVSLKEELDEYYLKPQGLAGGELGSMNLNNPDKGLVYTSSILGNNVAVAAGVALGKKVKGEGGAVFVVTGDGAIEEGSFYESLLFEKSSRLPVVTVIENNQWSLGTRIDERRCPIDIEKIAQGLNIPYHRLSSNNTAEYIERLSQIKAFALEQHGPACVEVELTTLGSWYVTTPENPAGRFINYHAGPAPKVNSEDGMILDPSSADPLFVLMGDGDQAEWHELYQKIFSDLEKEIAAT